MKFDRIKQLKSIIICYYGKRKINKLMDIMVYLYIWYLIYIGFFILSKNDFQLFVSISGDVYVLYW